MNTMSAQSVDATAAKYPHIFEQPFFKRYRAPIAAVIILAYLIFSWFFFGFGKAFSEGRWDIAGAYLSDWVSYEVRPDVEYDGDYLAVEFPRFSPLGSDPDPAWLHKTSEQVERQVEVEAGAGVGTENSAFSSTGSFMVEGAPGTQEGGADSEESSGSFMAPGTQTTGAGETTEAVEPEMKTVREVVTTEVNLEIGGAQILIVPRLVTVVYENVELVIDVVPDVSVNARGALPEWAEQREAGGDIKMNFGFAGTLEVESDEVKIRKRFLGWENFWFDTYSPFWGKSFTEVVGLVFSSDRIDPEMSNAALAFNDFLYNGEWQHLDVWIKLLQTIVMAFVGTLFATFLAFPLSFAAARNITPSRLVNQGLKRFFDFLRCVDMLIWALFFTRAFGPGPLAGISAIFFTDTGTLGKLYSEALENIDDRQREGIRSVGASPVLVQRYGVIPQVLPLFASQSLYFWESNTRSATIIGAVGAGGIGLKLWEAMRTNADWENVAYMVILILITVFVFDNISNAIRSRLMGQGGERV
ncbi:MAG: phosphonate ABC transporter, permease protein PhnE [Rhizobiaceae bacterium MnEN-MB40S]|nr:MAG: phosphonate ABC transporter, permease protein PhnE [Rhizobiaceae bacterium MnEN-MB40S]